MKGLIVKSPWIEKILNGEKSWEIRSSHTHTRGQIALIKSGTGLIMGTAEITDSLVLTFDEYQDTEKYHCIPEELRKVPPYKKIHAWKIENAKCLDVPISYVHPRGAVIWVNVEEFLSS